MPDNPITNIYSLIDEISNAEGVDPKLIHAMVKTESSYNPKAQPPINPKTGKRPSTAKGLLQLIDGTAAEMGVQDPFDPRQNLTGGIRYLKKHLNTTGGDVPKSLAMYYKGPGGDLTQAGDYVNMIKKNYGGDANFLNQNFEPIKKSYLIKNNPTDNIGEKPFMNTINDYLASLSNSNQTPAPQNSLNNLPEGNTNNKIFGMNPNEFSIIAGALGSAISGNTPLGRVGAVTSTIAGNKIAREEKLADIANAQTMKDAAENRGYRHDANMIAAKLGAESDLAERKMTQEEHLLDKSLTEQKRLSEIEYNRGADDRASQQKLRDIQVKKYQADLDDPKLSHMIGDDGVLTFFDQSGNIVKQTDPGIGQSARRDRFVTPETSEQINKLIEDQSFTNAKIMYDKDFGYTDAITGKLVGNEQIYKIKNFNNAIRSDVINYMNAKKSYAPEAYDKVIAGHAFNAAERALKSNSVEGIKAVLDQYPLFMHAQINDMMKKLNASQQGQPQQ